MLALPVRHADRCAVPGLQDFKGKVQQYGTSIGHWPPEAREVLLQYLMHAADISNPLRPPPLSSSWGCRIMEEFSAQVLACGCAHDGITAVAALALRPLHSSAEA